ncbi:uncharacterized protein [Palaemon carinicauda]|uniref:uncharacterized protein n=1 Tax=Palaemon carinicauda TaxID=392227 RepID=UPI0035B678FB
MAEDLCQGRACRGRVWCSREKRQAAVQLVLLCIASCSWTLLLISLTLTTSGSNPRHASKVIAETGPKWAEGGAEACQECLSRRGPPHSYWHVFERSLHQVAAALDSLDQPLAPSALSTQLRATRTLLRQLASVLHLPLIENLENQGSRKSSQEAILAAPGHVDGRLACPEQYLGSRAGYPRYHTGYFTMNCSSLPLREVITAILWDIERDHLSHLLDDFRRIYPGLPIRLVTDANIEGLPNLLIEKPRPSTAKALKRILSHVKTPYVFLGTKLTQMTNHSRLERLVWVAEWSGVWAVGGAGKGQDGRWRAGCLQVAEGGGQLVYTRGYTTSLFECQLCQSIEAPFVMRTKALQKLDWPRLGTDLQLLLPRMFLDIHTKAKQHKHGAALCPDSLFLVRSIDPAWDVTEKPQRQESELRLVAALWHSTAKKRRLSRLHLPSGFTVNYPCDFLPSTRQSHSTHFSPLSSERGIPAAFACQKRELSIIVTNLLKACSKLEVKCYLKGSSVTVFLSGGTLQSIPNKTLSFGMDEASKITSLQKALEVSHYVSFIENKALVIEGRWWTIELTAYNSKTTTNIEMLDGLWVPSVIPSSGSWTDEIGSCGVPVFHVDDTSQEERMSDLTSSPHCNRNHLSEMTLRSP